MANVLDALTLKDTQTGQVTEYEIQDKGARKQIAAQVSASTDSDANYAAEVVDARVGADGESYSSLGEAIRGQREKSKNEIESTAQRLKSLRKSVTGVYTSDEATENENSCVKNILYLLTDKELDFTGFRMNIIIDTEDFPRRIQITNGVTNYMWYFDSDSNEAVIKTNKIPSSEGTVVDTKEHLIKLGYNWEEHTKQVNVSYSNSHIFVDSTNSTNRSYNENSDGSEAKSTLSSVINEMSTSLVKIVKNNKVLSPVSSYEGKYITSEGEIRSWVLGTIEIFQVEAGKLYCICGKYSTGMLENTIAGFSQVNSLESQPINIVLMPTNIKVTYYEHYYIPQTNGYLYIVQNSTWTNNHIDVLEGSYAPNIPHNSIGLQELKKELSMHFIYVRSKLLESSTENQKYINDESDKTINSISNEVFSVKYYPVSKGDVVNLYGTAKLEGTSYPIAVFGLLKTQYTDVIIDGTLGGVSTDYDVIYEAPADGFIIISSRSSYGEVLCYSTQLVLEDKAPKTLKIQVFGDSITDNEINTWSGHTTWLNHIQKCFGKEWDLTVINSSYGGGSLSYNNEYCVWKRVHELLDKTADIYIIWGGTNDYASSRTLGDINSDETTVIGALKDCIEYITSNTTKMLIIATPIQRYNSFDKSQETKEVLDEYGNPSNGSYSLIQLSRAIKELCEIYGVDCIDLYGKSGFNKYNIGNHSSDGLHPHTNGANERIANIFADEIKRNFPHFL